MHKLQEDSICSLSRHDISIQQRSLSGDDQLLLTDKKKRELRQRKSRIYKARERSQGTF